MSPQQQPYNYGTMTKATVPEPLTWQVTGQTEVTQPTQDGRLAQGVRVTFQLSNGTSGSIFVPQQDYTLDKVRAMIQTRVDHIAGIGALNGTSTGPGSH